MSQDIDPAASALLDALHDHDDETYEHCLAVGRWSTEIGRALGLTERVTARAGAAGRLHDVGKVVVPVRLLQGGSPLSADEFVVVRSHAIAGEHLVAQAPSIAHLAPLVRAHHERIDGCGYPDGLKGAAIPIESRIVAVADTFDALTSGRTYRPAVSVTDALTILTATRARQWDPEVVAAFTALIEREGAIPRRIAVPA